MSAKGVTNGLRFEALVFQQLKDQGCTPVNSDRVNKLDSFIASPCEPSIFEAQRTAAAWLANRVIHREGLGKVSATGGTGFNDLEINIGGRTVGLSCKWNSNEINGARVTPNNYHTIPAHEQVIITSQQYRDECDAVFDLLKTHHGASFKDIMPDKHVMYITLRDALADEITRRNSATFDKALFSALVGHDDHYQVIGRKSDATIVGFNFNGTLNCTQTPSGATISSITPNGRDYNDVTVNFRGGWAFKWRIKNKSGTAGLGALGYSVTIEGSPNGMYRETK